jgi:hypothetical protein
MNPLDLEWGTATPEFIAGDSSAAIHVINHALEDRTQLARNLAFLRGRVAFFARHLPAEMKQHVIFDDRGQYIRSELRESLRASMTQIASFEYMSERE